MTVAGAFARLAALVDEPWLALDTETTGVGPHDQVVEVAAVARAGHVLFHSLVRPDRPVPARATAVHGLRARDLREAPTWADVWPELAPLLLETPLLAWNAAFDVRLLRQTCARHHQSFRLHSFLCLQQAFQWRFPQSRATLHAACLALAVKDRPKHRALPDARVTRQVALNLVKADPLA